jgi:SAM-dependent methyltransferase
MTYTEFVALVQEENRPSGGEATFSDIVINSHLFSGATVLEVGCTTGFSSLEVARLVPVHVEGIDVCQKSVEIAKSKYEAEKEELRGTARFGVASAYELPFPDSSFDLLITGNATSFMHEKDKAFDEYLRVTKPNGFISIVPLWYEKSPPPDLVSQVGNTIGCTLTPLNRQFWIDALMSAGLEITYEQDYEYDIPCASKLQDYCEFVLNRPHLVNLEADLREAIYKRLYETMSLFGKNLSYMRFGVFLGRKRKVQPEPQLFLRRGL